MRALLVSLLAALPTVALAGWPEDVTLSGMTEHGGVRVVDPAALSEDYSQLVRELGTAVGTRTPFAARTLGASGFAFSVDTSLSFVSGGNDADGSPGPWSRVQDDESGEIVTALPGFTVRKGLPFGLEVGMTGRWHAMTRQGVFSGFARVGILEGYAPWPDISVRLGYSGYVGNDELELGVFDAAVTLGATLPVGGSDGANTTQIAPFLDIALLSITAAPILDDATLTDIGAVAYGRRAPESEVITAEPAITLPQFSGGFELTSGKFLLRMSGGYALNSAAHASMALGVRY